MKEFLQATLLDGSRNKDELKKLIHTGGDPFIDDLITQATIPQLKNVPGKTSLD